MPAYGDLVIIVTPKGKRSLRRVDENQDMHTQDGILRMADVVEAQFGSEVCTTLGTLKENNRKCGNCSYFERCNGGCRAIALALTGDRLGIDPSKCLFWENGYAEKIAAALPDYETNI